MQKVAASELRKAIARGLDDPIFRATWGDHQAVLVRASDERSAVKLLRNMLEIDPDTVKPLTPSEMHDDELINEASVRCIEMNGYFLYEAFA